MIFIFISVMVPLLLLSYNLTIRKTNRGNSTQIYERVMEKLRKIKQTYISICALFMKKIVNYPTMNLRMN